jgi:hypothetical protein
MQKVFTGIARFFAVIFAIAFVVTAILSLLLTTFSRRLMNAETYKSTLANQQVYARLPRIIAEQLVTTMNYNPCATNPLMCEAATPEFQACALQKLGQERYATLSTDLEKPTDTDLQKIQPCMDQFGQNLKPQANGQPSSGPPAFMKSLGVADWETLIATLVPADELHALTDNTLDQVFAYLSGQQDTASISLLVFKNRISGPAGLEAVLEIIHSLPACSDEETKQMQAGLNGALEYMKICRPSEKKLDEMIPQIQDQLITYAAQIPAEKTILVPDTSQNSADNLFGGGISGQIRMARLFIGLSPDIPLLMFLFISLLVVRSPKSWLRWWGIPLFITGVISFGMTISAALTFEQAWLAFVSNRIPPYLSLGVVNLAHDLLRSISQSLLGSIRGGGFLLGLLGLGGIIGAAFIKVKAEPESILAPLPPLS